MCGDEQCLMLRSDFTVFLALRHPQTPKTSSHFADSLEAMVNGSLDSRQGASVSRRWYHQFVCVRACECARVCVHGDYKTASGYEEIDKLF